MCFFAGGTRFSEQGFAISACATGLDMLQMLIYSWIIRRNSIEFIAANVKCHRCLDSCCVSVVKNVLYLKYSSKIRYDMVAGGGKIATYSADQEVADILRVSHGVCTVLFFLRDPR